MEGIQEPTMREIRYLDKLVDELAKRKAHGEGMCGPGRSHASSCPASINRHLLRGCGVRAAARHCESRRFTPASTLVDTLPIRKESRPCATISDTRCYCSWPSSCHGHALFSLGSVDQRSTWTQIAVCFFFFVNESLTQFWREFQTALKQNDTSEIS